MTKCQETVCDPFVSWMERGSRVQKRLEKLTHGSAHWFVDDLCQQFLSDNNKDRILHFSTKLGEFQKSLYNCQHEVLQIDSYGQNYRMLENISQMIRTVAAWVDELLVLAMVDGTEVQQLLISQSYSTSVKRSSSITSNIFLSSVGDFLVIIENNNSIDS